MDPIESALEVGKGKLKNIIKLEGFEAWFQMELAIELIDKKVVKEASGIKPHTENGRYDLEWTQNKESVVAEIKIVDVKKILKEPIYQDVHFME